MSTAQKNLQRKIKNLDEVFDWVRLTLRALDHVDTIDKQQVKKVLRALLVGIRGGEKAEKLLAFRAFHTLIKESDFIQDAYRRYKKQYGAKAKSLLGWLRITENKAVLDLLKQNKFDDISLYLGKSVKVVDLKRINAPTMPETDPLEKTYEWLSKIHNNPGTQLTDSLLSKLGKSGKKPFEIGNIINLLIVSRENVPRGLLNGVKGSLGEVLTLRTRVDSAKNYFKNGIKTPDGKRIHFDEILVVPRLRGDYVDVDGKLLKGKETTDGIVVGKVAGKDSYQILEIHEVKTSVDGVYDAKVQFTTRQENLGQLSTEAEGVLSLIPEGTYYKWEKGKKKVKAVEVSEKDPLTLNLNRLGDQNTIGYHQAKMKMFVPSDQMVSLDPFNKRFSLESIGLPWESLEKLGAYLTANLMK